MEQKRHIRITFSSIDGIIQTYERTDCIYPYMQSLSFQYVADYFKTGKWANEAPGYVPVVQEIAGRKANAFTDAMVLYEELVNRVATQAIAQRCTVDVVLAAAVVAAASEIVKSQSDYEKKQWQKKRRLLREHEKAGKSLWSDYCGIVDAYKLYTIISFDFAEIE